MAGHAGVPLRHIPDTSVHYGVLVNGAWITKHDLLNMLKPQTSQ
jgi:hypothetical protein